MPAVVALERAVIDSWPSSANDSAPVPRSLLRFIACGSVDDGKSTLIGRLLFETNVVPDDTLSALKSESRKTGATDGGIDYSLLVDGLSAEREQGITIDVAYRYFATKRRNFIVADTPGHEQYTRNMATGASTVDLAIILIDASKGILPQTRRHSLIMSLVGVRHVIVAINKMDMIAFDESRYREIEQQYRILADGLAFATITTIPIVARDGDNIVAHSQRMPWYDGAPLLAWLETIDTEQAVDAVMAATLPVQYVNRPDADFRGFCGEMASGVVSVGDRILALPSGQHSHVARIIAAGSDVNSAVAGQAVTIALNSEIDVSRGDVLVASDVPPATLATAQDIIAQVLVTGAHSFSVGSTFLLRLGTMMANANVMEIIKQIDVHDFSRKPAAVLTLNSLGTVRLRIDRPIVHTPYQMMRELGSLVLIDKISNATIAIGVIPAFSNPTAHDDARTFLRVVDSYFRKTIGAHWRSVVLRAASWRLISALCLAAAIYFTLGNMQAGMIAGFLDIVCRSTLKILHRRAWTWVARRRNHHDVLFQDGEGI